MLMLQWSSLGNITSGVWHFGRIALTWSDEDVYYTVWGYGGAPTPHGIELSMNKLVVERKIIFSNVLRSLSRRIERLTRQVYQRLGSDSATTPAVG
jgi:hypothetical protein